MTLSSVTVVGRFASAELVVHEGKGEDYEGEATATANGDVRVVCALQTGWMIA